MPSGIKKWENVQGQRFYLVEKSGRLLGIFSNRKKLFEALNFSGIENCCIHGKRKNKEVNDSTIGDELIANDKFCKIWRGEEVAFRVWEIGLNHINPEIIAERTKESL